jgi:insertion element IS1 protein InsB
VRSPHGPEHLVHAGKPCPGEVYLCWSITGGEATNRRYSPERQWHSRYRARVARQPYNSTERIKKKEPELTPVNQAVLQHLHPACVEVEIWHADALEVRRGRSSELDEMWSYVQSKVQPHWLWHAIDHHTGTVLAYVFGRRQDTVFLELKALLEPFGITHYFTDGWGAYGRHLEPEQHTVGKANTQKIESKHTTYAHGSSGWSAGRSVFQRQSVCTTW